MPNMRECKLKKKSIEHKKNFPIRLRGGANHEDYSMIERAIANAKAQDINVHSDYKTAGNGNCIFECQFKGLIQ